MGYWEMDTVIGISIHALLAESDPQMGAHSPARQNFYPRSPCGERHRTLGRQAAAGAISIHALLAESDTARKKTLGQQIISIHALLAENDGNSAAAAATSEKFLSTLSLRRAT